MAINDVAGETVYQAWDSYS